MADVPNPTLTHRSLGFFVAALTMFLDQAVKAGVTWALDPARNPYRFVEIVPVFDLRWVENRGVSMGFLTAGSALERWGLVALTIVIMIGVIAWLWREQRRPDAIALGLVLGGAIGNILDRVRFGYVVDYADLHFGEFRPFLVFNLADAAITIGVLLLVLRALLTRDKPETGNA